MIIDFIFFLIVAAICGSIGAWIAGYDSGGCLLSIVTGFIGAVLGTYLYRLLGLPAIWLYNYNGTAIPIIWTILASAGFVAIISAIGKKRRWRRRR